MSLRKPRIPNAALSIPMHQARKTKVHASIPIAMVAIPKDKVSLPVAIAVGFLVNVVVLVLKIAK